MLVKHISLEEATALGSDYGIYWMMNDAYVSGKSWHCCGQNGVVVVAWGQTSTNYHFDPHVWFITVWCLECAKKVFTADWEDLVAGSPTPRRLFTGEIRFKPGVLFYGRCKNAPNAHSVCTPEG